MCQHEDIANDYNMKSYPCCGCGNSFDNLDNMYEQYEMGIFEDYDGCNDYTDEELPSLEDASEDDLRSVGMWSDEDVKTDEDYDHFGYDRHDVDTPMGEDYGGE